MSENYLAGRKYGFKIIDLLIKGRKYSFISSWNDNYLKFIKEVFNLITLREMEFCFFYCHRKII